MEYKSTVTGQMVEAKPWQLALKAGDYYCIAHTTISMQNEKGEWETTPGPTIYGEIITNEPEEGEPPYRPGFFLVRGYSQLAPTGELGEFCIVDPTHQLTKADFEAARAWGWPDYMTLQFNLGNVCPYCYSTDITTVYAHYLHDLPGDMFRCLDCDRTWNVLPPDQEAAP